jgi:mono/diheme cytochrome c family protein
VLARIDKGLALLSWLAAAAVAVMLVAGPKLVAHDDEKQAAVTKSPYAASASTGPDGGKLFKDNCGACHALTAAGTSGAVGPKLDDTSLDAAAIEAKIRTGGGSMPAFKTSLTNTEIAAIAEFVANR